LLLVALWASGPGCAEQGARAPQPSAAPRKVTATPWPEADALFRQDPTWLGGDAAVSVALGPERVLWLFGDSFIATQPAAAAGAPSGRAGARFVHNSIGLQRGSDPSGAQMRFFHGTAPDGAPASFFAEQGDAWVWPGHGLYQDGTLTLFLLRVRADTAQAGGLGFAVVGWTALRIADADAEPDAWQPQPLPTPDTGELRIVGAQVLLEGDFVYVYAVREPGDHAIMLLRWPRDAFTRGDLMQPSYWDGHAFGVAGPAAAVMAAGAAEFSVSPVPQGGYVQVQSRGFGAAPIALRFAARPSGPWSEQLDAFLPEEAARGGVLIYAGRAHPELRGADLVVTYAVNTLDPARVLEDLGVYFPRFVRIDL
jgi:hypothetical protein